MAGAGGAGEAHLAEEVVRQAAPAAAVTFFNDNLRLHHAGQKQGGGEGEGREDAEFHLESSRGVMDGALILAKAGAECQAAADRKSSAIAHESRVKKGAWRAARAVSGCEPIQASRAILRSIRNVGISFSSAADSGRIRR